MKKEFLSLLLLSAVSICSYAQLKVESNGNIVAGTKLMNNGFWKTGFQSGLTSASESNNAAIYGKASNNTGSASYGVFGVAESSSVDGNYGVAGCLQNSNLHGAGIIGSTYHITNMGLSSAYAGYFMGNARVTGTMTVNSLVQTSDSRLKENIVFLRKRDNSILDKVLNMNVIEYNYKPIIPSLVLPDSVSTEEVVKKTGLDTNKKHYGVIAQELQELFPALVDEDQDGYLGVNYVELVPVLVCAIQELKAELEAIKVNGTERRAPSVTGFSTAKATDNVLYQNTPNPFNEQTTIRFSLDDDARDASICIFDMTGKILKKLPISSGDRSIKINGWELGEGMFLYSLIVNGQVIDTKRMVISKY